MRDLSFQELQDIQKLSRPESLKGCARAYAVATTYFPPLLAMADKYLKLSVDQRIKKGYSVGLTPEGEWCIRCADGFEEKMGRGQGSKVVCERLVSRLNGNI